MSFWKSFFIYLLFGFLVALLLVYGYWAFVFHKEGAPFLDSLLWFRETDFLFTAKYSFFLLLLSYFLGAAVSSYCFVKAEVELSELENLKEKRGALVKEVKELLSKINEAKGELEVLSNERDSLKETVKELKERKSFLEESVRELKEVEENLEEFVREAVERGYREGWEKVHKKVMTELRSLRAQKSALVDLFTKHRELQELFKRITGKKFLQYLNEVKRSLREGEARVVVNRPFCHCFCKPVDSHTIPKS